MGDALVIALPAEAPDPIDAVVALDITGKADTTEPPQIVAEMGVFVDQLDVMLTSDRENVELRYTLTGDTPIADSPLAIGPIPITETCTLQARAFRAGQPVSGVRARSFEKVAPRQAQALAAREPGLHYDYYEGDWSAVPDFAQLASVKRGVVSELTVEPRDRAEHFAFRYRGLIEVPRDGMYRFSTTSDDGSRLWIGEELVVDNDGLHSARRADGWIALAAGPHEITVAYFEKSGGDSLEVEWQVPDAPLQRVPASVLFHEP